RHLGDQAVANGELGECAHAAKDVPSVLDLADRHAANDVDKDDDDPGDGIAADELRGTIHGPVELGLPGNIRTPPPGLILLDQTGVEVGVDRHLLAGHRVEGEPCGYFGDTSGTFGDDHELNHDQDDEDDDPDHHLLLGAGAAAGDERRE